ncbi:hypothetical protein Dimus_039035 [Dionaea muscipula]
MTKDETSTLLWQRRQLLNRCTVPLAALPLDVGTDLCFNDYWQGEVELIFGWNTTDAMIACLTGKEKKRSRPTGQEKKAQKKEAPSPKVTAHTSYYFAPYAIKRPNMASRSYRRRKPPKNLKRCTPLRPHPLTP